MSDEAREPRDKFVDDDGTASKYPRCICGSLFIPSRYPDGHCDIGRKYDAIACERDELRDLFNRTATLIIPGGIDTSDAYLLEFRRLTALCEKLSNAIRWASIHLKSMEGYSIVSGARHVLQEALEDK